MNLVPTASTTAALAIGDALAMTLLVEKGFRQEDFANLHPGGTLGKSLMRVESLMHIGAECPVVRTTTSMQEVIAEISRKTFGMTCVVDASGALAGVITDGDLRRQIEKGVDVRGLTAADVMTRGPIAVTGITLAAEALNIMETRHVTSLIVVEPDSKHVAGVVHLHDLWRTEMI
jgi:arabinose-5-phosphate isomerase